MRRPFAKLTALAGAAALSLSFVAAAATPARADSDLGRIVAGAAAVAIIGSAIANTGNDRHVRPQYYAPPPPPPQMRRGPPPHARHAPPPPHMRQGPPPRQAWGHPPRGNGWGNQPSGFGRGHGPQQGRPMR